MDETKLLAWILRGSQRRVIFKSMQGEMIPAQIYEASRKENSKISRNNVSDVLREFQEKGIATCINPEEQKGRIYILTKKGLKLKKRIQSASSTTQKR